MTAPQQLAAVCVFADTWTCFLIWWVLCWWRVKELTVVSAPGSSSSAQSERERWQTWVSARHYFASLFSVWYTTQWLQRRKAKYTVSTALSWLFSCGRCRKYRTYREGKKATKEIGEVTAVKKKGKEKTSEMEADRKISDSETEKLAGAGKYIIVVWCLWRFTYSHCGTINGALTHRSMTGIFMSATAISFKPTANQNLVSSQYLLLLLPHDVHYSDSIRGRQEIIKVATQIK